MNKKDEVKKTKRQFWMAFGIFMGIVGLLTVGYLVLSTLKFLDSN